ncbi:MAG: hypothetical protein F6J93_12485 [Oscillatoria sp. SIO1A7]|nr:hypothetical protein [Oscillatoria sp. SIO1A7]
MRIAHHLTRGMRSELLIVWDLRFFLILNRTISVAELPAYPRCPMPDAPCPCTHFPTFAVCWGSDRRTWNLGWWGLLGVGRAGRVRLPLARYNNKFNRQERELGRATPEIGDKSFGRNSRAIYGASFAFPCHKSRSRQRSLA